MRRISLILTSVACLLLSACVSAPAPKYQPGIDNSSLLLQQRLKMDVGTFTAAQDVENRSLGLRGSQLKGGSDGTYATYLREALVTELETAQGFVPGSDLQLEGQLTANELNASIKEGTAKVGARFVLKRQGQVVYDKALVAEHGWESSFVGAIAIPAAMDNYGTTVQKLIGKLLADPEFIAATRGA
jgi:hypothetical protein